jgi:hypothetical protein
MSNNISLQEQSLIDKTLINAGLPQNKLSSLIALATEKLACDSNCQQKRSAEDYRKKWELAKKQYKEAPEQISLAEKNYYVYDKGYPAYKDMLYDRYSKNVNEFKKSSNIKYKKTNEEITDMIDTYDTSSTYLIRMNELLRVKLEENERLKREIDNYISTYQTSGRKVIYEDRERDWLGTLRKIFIFIYFCMLIGYIIFGNFIPNKEYLQLRVWIYILFYIIFPFFLLNRIVRFVFSLFTYFASWKLNTNVYTNL